MKRLFLTLTLVIALVAASPVQAGKKQITTQGDTTIIIDGQDTAVITSKIAGTLEKVVNGKILEHLDDTVVDASGDGEGAADFDEARRAAYEHQEKEGERFVEVNRIWATRLEHIMAYLGMSIVCIVALVLFFRFLNRRRKYKVLEKAIENNYPLPDGVFEGKTVTKVVYANPQQPATGAPMQGTPVPPPFTQGVKSDAQGQQQAQAKAQPQYDFNNIAGQINWREIKGINHFVGGLVFSLFFLFAAAEPVAILGLIPMAMGASKIFISYMDQRNAVIAAQQYAQQQPQQQPAAAPEAPQQVPEVPVQETEQPENNGPVQL